ncbi:ABC transporter permease [Virgisporangium ochraceum]
MNPFTPAPGRAPAHLLLLRHARFELVINARRAEALVLSLGVPILGLLAVVHTAVISLPGDDRAGYVVPGVIALTTLSTAFTGQAISVGYERFYGALARLGASSLTRTGLVAGKTLATLVLVLAQALVVALVGLAVGWRPQVGHLVAVVAATLLATAAYCGFALVLASLTRPEATTAGATLVYAVLLVGGGTLFPAPDLGGAEYLVPVTAHATVLRAALTDGMAADGLAWLSLAAWSVVAVVAARRAFRWD